MSVCRTAFVTVIAFSSFGSTAGRAEETPVNGQPYSLEIAIVRRANSNILFGKKKCSQNEICTVSLGEKLIVASDFTSGKYKLRIDQDEKDSKIDCCFFQTEDIEDITRRYYLFIPPNQPHTQIELRGKAYNPMLAMGDKHVPGSSYGRMYVTLKEQ